MYRIRLRIQIVRKLCATTPGLGDTRDWTLRLTPRLYERGYQRQDILNLFRFIDWLMVLPESFTDEVAAEIARYEQEGTMPYVTRIERRAEERGLIKGECIMLTRLLTRKFGELPEEILGQLNRLTIEQLEALGEEIFDWGTIADLEQWLAGNLPESSEDANR